MLSWVNNKLIIEFLKFKHKCVITRKITEFFFCRLQVVVFGYFRIIISRWFTCIIGQVKIDTSISVYWLSRCFDSDDNSPVTTWNWSSLIREDARLTSAGLVDNGCVSVFAGLVVVEASDLFVLPDVEKRSQDEVPASRGTELAGVSLQHFLDYALINKWNPPCHHPGPRWGFDLTSLQILTNPHPTGAYWWVKPPPRWGNLCCTLVLTRVQQVFGTNFLLL